jgi:endonuclease-3
MNRNQKITAKFLHTLEPLYPAKGMVDMGNPEDTLIATLLSARTTDVQVVKVYPGLRKKFPTLADLAAARVEDIAKAISSIGLYRNKAKAIKALAQILIEKHNGKVPARMEDLVELPGVGRKTASCVLWYGFGIPAMAVDTHVFRIAHRAGWAKGKTAERVEQELMKIVPQPLWGTLNRLFVQFGRDVCKPITPACWRCPVREMCAYKKKTIR